MNRYTKNLKDFLSQQTPNYGYADAESLMELLYYSYTSDNPVDNSVIRYQFKQLDDILNHLSLDENNAIFRLAGELCIAHERQAFLDGIHVGLRLFSELNDLQDI